MECTKDETALRSKIRTTRRVTHVIALNASAACQTSIDLTASCSINLPPKVLVTINCKVLTVSFLSSDRQHRSFDRHHTDYVTNHLVFRITILVLLCHRSCMSICRPHEHRTIMIVLTVTPIDRLHKSDEPNGVKGAAEEDKI